MKPKINQIFNLVEDWNCDELERLNSELEVLAEYKYNRQHSKIALT